MTPSTTTASFLNPEALYRLAEISAPETSRLDELLAKAKELHGLELAEAAELLAVADAEGNRRILETASFVKREIYGSRIVLFAPLYTGNDCTNDCLYCGFRSSNRELVRRCLTRDEIADETRALLREGHKRLLLLCGESGRTPLSSTLEAIETTYSVELDGAKIRRINVEIAPMDVQSFRRLAGAGIGTYTCFQETYDPALYREYHLRGAKADYENRLTVMHRAMEAGLEDVGIGALFGLAPWKFEALAMMRHAEELEARFGCGPHTVSVPRIEPAPGAPLTEHVPYPVGDDDFMRLVAVLRIAMPYVGIILSTREPTELRTRLFRYGVSQVSAGSRTSPGGYTHADDGVQFSLGDRRSLEEVIRALVGERYIPSFCTGCYRKGRVGNDFMDLAKPGLIKSFCMPNGLVSFAEYLEDYAGAETREAGYALIEELAGEESSSALGTTIRDSVARVRAGERDIYL